MIREMKESMDIDSIEESKRSTQNLKENVFTLYPVSVNDSGEGLPYAPENWPNPGDKWSWKVGKRIGNHGYFLDRYMYLPVRLCTTGRRKESFASRLSLEQYIRAKFPDTDVNDFFALFSWKIPSTFLKEDDKQIFRLPGNISEHQGSELHNNIVHCKAGNRLCSSLDLGVNSISEVIFCDICCNEPSFCRDCCCILCCRIINNVNSDFGHIRCEANIEGRICGHNCHMDCALRAYMAGTVGGSIGLDAEYYCRHCDSRTDLVLHVTKILQKCESMDSRDELEKVLRVGICILRGSKRTSAEQLLHRIELAMLKLKNGTNLEDILKMEDDAALIPVLAGQSLTTNGSSDFSEYKESQDTEMVSLPMVSTNFDNGVESLKLEDKVNQILQALRKSQEIEYNLAEEKLHAQKNYILNLYHQLEEERSDLCKLTSVEDKDLLLDVVLSRVDRIKHEVSRLKEVEEVAKGFGRVPKYILKEHFGLDYDH